MADLLVVFLAVIATLIFLGMVGWLPSLTSRRNLIEGEIKIPLGHRYFLETPTDRVRIVRIGVDWILPEGESIPHKGFVLGQNMFVLDSQSQVAREKVFFSALCLDHYLRYNFSNPMLRAFFEKIEESIARQVKLENELKFKDFVESQAKDSLQRFQEVLDLTHNVYRSVGVRMSDKARRGLEQSAE